MPRWRAVVALCYLFARCRNDLLLETNQRLNAAHAERYQFIHLGSTERLTLGCSLKFDKAAIAGAHNVHIDFGARVFVILEIQEGTLSTMPTLIAAT